MPKKKDEKSTPKRGDGTGVIKNAGLVVEQPITETLETNYMPYAMSVIVSRAIPEIDGFTPAHRKLLYTMYKMGLLTGGRTKSANVVGQTMRLNPHGDASIYDTLVRLSRGYDALLHPFIDSKGNFGKSYSRDMAYAASRYTEVKLDSVSAELFRDIDKNTVDMLDNYDNTMKEPALLPATFPTVLVNANMGIAVGMASSIPSFNLNEVCETTIRLLRDPQHDVSSTLKAPDFTTGGLLLYDRAALEGIYATGRGSVRVRARWGFDKLNNCIEVTQIPPTTTVEAIMDKIIELVKAGRVREVADLRDETDLDGLKLTIDCKRGVDPDKLMQRLFRMTPLEDSFACNFNVLIDGRPRTLGVAELLGEWARFRVGCVRRRLEYDLSKYKEKLHLLKGLGKILLDIDKAVRIVRETEEEAEVVPNLMIGFGIDEMQAEYVAEIRLRHLNREYILKRTAETSDLEAQIADLESTLADPQRVKGVIVAELLDVMKRHGRPRRTEILYDAGEAAEEPEEQAPDYPVTLFLTRDGYFKKITPQSLRMSGEHKLKEGDEITQTVEATNRSDLLFFTNRSQVYKARACDFEDTKASVLGEYIPGRLGFDEGEGVFYMAVTTDYAGFMLFFFQNGKAAKVELSAYATKLNRKKLVGAYSDASPLAACTQEAADREYRLTASSGRVLLVHTGAIAIKTTRATQGVAVMTLKRGQTLFSAAPYNEGDFVKPDRYRVRSLPAAGQIPPAEEMGTQMTF